MCVKHEHHDLPQPDELEGLNSNELDAQSVELGAQNVVGMFNPSEPRARGSAVQSQWLTSTSQRLNCPEPEAQPPESEAQI